ncbi:hypothetical protein BIV04_07810 [Frigoribacterium sp. MCBA15_019]|nr:hypothetical protein BIV04_07810 [Frigoribacterium sp. MCBA15_019]
MELPGGGCRDLFCRHLTVSSLVGERDELDEFCECESEFLASSEKAQAQRIVFAVVAVSAGGAIGFWERA